MAAEYMLGIYIVVRFLLVFWSEKVEARSNCLCSRDDYQFGDEYRHAAEQGAFRCVDSAWKLYVIDDTYGEGFEAYKCSVWHMFELLGISLLAKY